MQRKDMFDNTRTVEEVEKSEAGCALALDAISGIAAVICDNYFIWNNGLAAVEHFNSDNGCNLSGIEKIAVATYMEKMAAAMQAIKHISETQLEILYGD